MPRRLVTRQWWWCPQHVLRNKKGACVLDSKKMKTLQANYVKASLKDKEPQAQDTGSQAPQANTAPVAETCRAVNRKASLFVRFSLSSSALQRTQRTTQQTVLLRDERCKQNLSKNTSRHTNISTKTAKDTEGSRSAIYTSNNR